jgi:hypothetical protein
MENGFSQIAGETGIEPISLDKVMTAGRLHASSNHQVAFRKVKE